jgi:hypothetical protein
MLIQSPKVDSERMKYSPLLFDRSGTLNTPTTEIKIRKLDFNTSSQIKDRLKKKIFMAKTTKKEETKKFRCNCTKSNCLKGYCVCFANGEKCSGCECTMCENDIKDLKPDEVNNIPTSLPEHCKCTKSNCQKKYCECYRQGKPCDPVKCRCLSCNNKEPVKVVETLDLEVNRIRVMILKNKIYMDEELDDEDIFEDIEPCRFGSNSSPNLRRKRKRNLESYIVTPQKSKPQERLSTCDKTSQKKNIIKKRFEKSTKQIKKKL